MKIKKKYIIIPLVMIVLVIAGYFVFNRKKPVTYNTAKITRGNIVQTVSETGTVKSESQLDLNFSVSGMLKKKLFKVGDKVKIGQILAELDYTDLTLKASQARAGIASANANLKKVQNGPTAAQISVSQAALDQAKTALSSAEKDLVNVRKTVNESIAQSEKNYKDLISVTDADITTYEQAVTVAQTAMENAKRTYQRNIDNAKTSALSTIENKFSLNTSALDAIDRILNDQDAKNLLGVKDPTYLDLTKAEYDSGLGLLSKATIDLKDAKTDDRQLPVALDAAESSLFKAQSALNNCLITLTKSITTFDFTQSELDAFKTTVNNQLTAVGAAITTVQAAHQSYNDARLNYDNNVNTAEKNLAQSQAALSTAKINAKNALDTAKVSGDQQVTASESRVDSAKRSVEIADAQLKQLISPARSEDIALARSQLDQANSALSQINEQMDNFRIKSPIDGTVTKDNYQIGELTSPTRPVVSMIGKEMFEIEVDISESDISKINLNDKVEVTLDAFGEDLKFYGRVYFIEPAETIIQDVVYYKVKVVFNPGKYEVRTGMTANVTITTDSRDNALVIPVRAVIEANGQKSAKILEGGVPKEVPIKIGLAGDEGMTELLSGLDEGQEIIISTK
jgi:HlyD family secretion protein